LERVKRVLVSQLGWVEQIPPAFSALKIQGKPAYSLARKGVAVEMPIRKVRIDAIEIGSYVWPLLRIEVRCGRGTYIRGLARRIGQLLETGGHLTALRRLAVGPFRVEEAVALAALPVPLTQEFLRPVPDEGER
jgi:tRNA pseudouridine55 synthase